MTQPDTQPDPELTRLQAENARLREACRAALAELAEYEDVLRRLSKSRSSDGNYVGAISADCEATGVFVAQRIFNRHL